MSRAGSFCSKCNNKDHTYGTTDGYDGKLCQRCLKLVKMIIANESMLAEYKATLRKSMGLS